MSEAAWFETIDRRTVHEGFSVVHVDTVRMPDGDVVEREVIEHPDAVAVVPLLADGSVVLLRQYRHPIGQYVLEIPAGILDVDGEDRVDAAQRELAEEIGMRAGRMVELTTMLNSVGWNDEATTVYLATDLEEAPAPDGFVHEAEEADMERVRMPLADAVAEVRAGTIRDAKTVVGLLLAEGT